VAKEAFHVIWITYQIPKPENVTGQWTGLLEVYGQIQEKGWQVFVPALIAAKGDVRQQEKQVLLTSNEVIATRSYLEELTREDGDRLAAGNTIVAQVVTPQKVELLLECAADTLQAVVGRLKSKSATALLWDRPAQNHIWSKGFWYAHLLDRNSRQCIENYMLPGLQRACVFITHRFKKRVLMAKGRNIAVCQSTPAKSRLPGKATQPSFVQEGGQTLHRITTFPLERVILSLPQSQFSSVSSFGTILNSIRRKPSNLCFFKIDSNSSKTASACSWILLVSFFFNLVMAFIITG
jgi:hypothetical protein